MSTPFRNECAMFKKIDTIARKYIAINQRQINRVPSDLYRKTALVNHQCMVFKDTIKEMSFNEIYEMDAVLGGRLRIILNQMIYDKMG